MLFNSQTFILFVAVVLALYWSWRARVPQNVLLLAASYVFYGAWSWKFLLLMLASTLFDYCCGRLIGATADRNRKWHVLVASIAVNLGVLFAFKYLGFFVTETAALLTAFGLHPNMSVLEIVLPVGISFYTFQSLGYVVDVYRGKVKAQQNLLTYALYVAFFPQLVAGPIERAAHLMPQFERERTINRAAVESGLFLIVWGLFKKVTIADNLAPYVDAVFGAPGEYSAAATATAVVFFAFQIYCDFSGYTDTARGTARLLGFELVHNFRYPYVATSPVDFWRRWHISLSQWFQDYLYYPLAMRYMRRGGWASKYKAHIVAMALIGVWHGANWTFLAFGLYWGILIALYLAWSEHVAQAGPSSLGRRLQQGETTVQRVAAVAIMFVLVCVGWILFRADSLHDALHVMAGVFRSGGSSTVTAPRLLSEALLWLMIGGLLAAEWFARRHERIAKALVADPPWSLFGRHALIVLVLFFFLEGQQGPARPFIYFQF